MSQAAILERTDETGIHATSASVPFVHSRLVTLTPDLHDGLLAKLRREREEATADLRLIESCRKRGWANTSYSGRLDAKAREPLRVGEIERLDAWIVALEGAI